MLESSVPSQDFDPEEFHSTIAEDGMDKQQLVTLMSSSHTPYILNRLNTTLAMDGGEEGLSLCVCVWGGGACACVRACLCVCVCVRVCVYFQYPKPSV